MTVQTAPTSSQTTTSTKAPRRKPVPLNGVDVPTLLATRDVVAGQPELASFQFTATNRWVEGCRSRTEIGSFTGAGGEHTHAAQFIYEADHPTVLVGGDQAPAPVEFILHALASCLMGGIGNIASARGVKLYKVQAKITGDIDLRGALGLSDDVRNGFSNIRVSFDIQGDASAEKLAEIVEQSKKRSAVYDIVTGNVPVQIEVA